MKISISERIAIAEQAHREGRIIQNAWRRSEDGRELVCALAAFGPDINSAADCPADLMPQWLAELVPTLDDGVVAADVPWFSGELIDRTKRRHVLDVAAWDRVRTGFLIATIKTAVDSAAAVQPTPAPDYWAQVTKACEGVVAALEGQGDIDATAKAAWAAAWAAADATAKAAWAAADAAWAAWAAADAAADAARAAARAAADAARAAADAADAAGVQYRKLAELLFAIIDAELEAAK